MGNTVDLPQGALEMLILKASSLGPLHGYGILLRIQQISGERLEILQGSFTPQSIGLNGEAGSEGNGANQRIIARPSSIALPTPASAS